MESGNSLIGTTALTTDRGDVQLKMGAEFEVFLNFRGPDTRLNFADCLYHSMDGAGIRVFRDDEEIRKGEAIGGELERAIKSSTICMPIFSRNYASNPDDVQLKTGLYHETLQKQEEKFGCDVVQQWKEALREVARIKGWHLGDRGYGELIRLIVAEVLIKLNSREKNLPDDLVGIQNQFEDVMHLLDEGSPDLSFGCSRSFKGRQIHSIAKTIIVRNSQLHTNGDF
ncbi:disease resistance protein L6-like [Syzygium oleosum]|uniref:disease resistance protein L6-like n=1 Tax=Syzygium oleosum TaxID=219896 RepID=UPI0024B8BAA8|nr:disease resistance protein L6-like [Syzygium oleosum]